MTDKELAEKHWEYTANLMRLSGTEPTELMHYLYVQSMIHGIKHGRSDNDKTK